MMQTSVWKDWLETLLADSVWGYYRGFNLALWIFAIGIMYGVGIVFWIRANKPNVIPSQTWLLKSFTLLFFFQGITRISFVLSYFIEPYYNFLLALGYAFAAISLLPLIITIEKWSTPQTHKIFTFMAIVVSILGFYFIFDPSQSDLSRTIQEIAMPVMIVLFLILYLWMIKNSTGAVRKKAILALLGAIVFIAGILLDSEGLIKTIQVIFHFAPIVFTLGVVIIGVSQKVD